MNIHKNKVILFSSITLIIIVFVCLFIFLPGKKKTKSKTENFSFETKKSEKKKNISFDENSKSSKSSVPKGSMREKILSGTGRSIMEVGKSNLKRVKGTGSFYFNVYPDYGQKITTLPYGLLFRRIKAKDSLYVYDDYLNEYFFTGSEDDNLEKIKNTENLIFLSGNKEKIKIILTWK